MPITHEFKGTMCIEIEIFESAKDRYPDDAAIVAAQKAGKVWIENVALSKDEPLYVLEVTPIPHPDDPDFTHFDDEGAERIGIVTSTLNFGGQSGDYAVEQEGEWRYPHVR